MAKGDGYFRACKQTTEDHNKWVRYNQQLALAEAPIHKNTKGNTITKKTCHNCGKKRICIKNKPVYKDGAVSIDSSTSDEVCKDWVEPENRRMSQKQQKSLLKQFSKKLK